MTLEVNGTKMNALPAQQSEVKQAAAEEKPVSVFNEAEPERMSRHDRKEWIKEYAEEHNCSKSDAKKAFNEEYETDMMSRKDAKSWCKDYMEKMDVPKKRQKPPLKNNLDTMFRSMAFRGL